MPETSSKIKVVSFKSPSKIFFYFLDDDQLELVKKSEEEVQKAVGSLENNKAHVPEQGEICAFFHQPLKKWIRVRFLDVREINQVEIATLKCVDYGCEIQTHNFLRFAPLPVDLAVDYQLVRTLCLPLLPAKLEFDTKKRQMITKSREKWSQLAIEMTVNYLRLSDGLKFVTTQDQGDVLFGDILMDVGEQKSLSLIKELLRANEAIESQNLKSVLRLGMSSFEEEVSMFDLPDSPKKLPSSNFEKIAKILQKSMSSSEVSLKPGSKGAPMIHRPRSVVSKSGSSDVASKLGANEVASNVKPCSVVLESGLRKDEQTVEKSLLSPNSKSRHEASNNSKEPVSTPARSVKIHSAVKSSAPHYKALPPTNPSEYLQPRDHVKLFIHGENLEPPLDNISSAHFQPIIHENLVKMKHTQVFRTQMHSVPNILSGRSVVIVNEKKSGKTFSYLPAVLSSIMFTAKGEPEGPIGLFVVGSSREAEILLKHCEMLTSRKIKIFKASGQWNLDKKVVELMNGCDLLITTAPFFVRIGDSDFIKAFENDRLKHVVFDEIDSMWEDHQQDIKKIVAKCFKGDPGENPQVIVVSKRWIKQIRHFMKLSIDPLVIIGSFADAALYGKCHFVVRQLKFEEKAVNLLQLIAHYQMRKILVVADKVELKYLESLLVSKDIICSTLSENEEVLHRCEQKVWENEDPGKKVYLMTDEKLIRCFITSVDVLIHFSLPTNISKFSQRFASMSGVFLKVAQGEEIEKPVSVIFLDQEGGIEIPRVVEFLRTRRVLKEVPLGIQELVDEIVTKHEKNKINESFEKTMPLCANIPSFGSCPLMVNCKKRHAFIASEKPINTPCDGYIRFEFVGIHNPAHFTIKILEYLPQGSKAWISCKKKLKKIAENLAEMQNVLESSTVYQVAPQNGDLCAFFDQKTAQWCRCRVVDREKQPSIISETFKVRVLLIDSGLKSTVQSDSLMVLPEKFKFIDPLVTELHVANLVPFDKEVSWDTETTNELCGFFSSKKNTGDYMICKVELAVQNSIFTQNFEIRVHDNVLSVDVTKYMLKKSLLEKSFCCRDENVLMKLKKLATDCGFYVPPPEIEQTKKVSRKTKANKISWKKLSLKSDYQVELKHFESPDEFYVTVVSRENKVLKNLMKTVDNCQQRIAIEEIVTDKLCLVVKGDNKPKRGMINKLDPLEIFLVDSGEFVTCEISEIFEMPQQVAQVAPFQAVFCAMLGVKPKFGQEVWTPRKLKEIQDFMKENCEGKILNLRVLNLYHGQYVGFLSLLVSGTRLDELLVKEDLADGDHAREDENFDVDENVENHQETDDQKIGEMREQIIKLMSEESPRISEETPETVIQLPAQVQKSEIVQNNPKPKPRTNDKLDIPKSSSLDFIHKHPKIEWRQNREKLHLIISAVDCIDFALNIAATGLKIVISYDDEVFEMAAFRFYGLIDPDTAKYGKAGQTIVVQMEKAMSMIGDWPRLTIYPENTRYIKFSNEEIPHYGSQEQEQAGCGVPPDIYDEECSHEIEDEDDEELN